MSSDDSGTTEPTTRAVMALPLGERSSTLSPTCFPRSFNVAGPSAISSAVAGLRPASTTGPDTDPCGSSSVMGVGSPSIGSSTPQRRGVEEVLEAPLHDRGPDDHHDAEGEDDQAGARRALRT